MLQLQNLTPFAASMALFPNEDAIDTLYVMVRATFKIGKQWALAEEQLPPTEADEYWGEPGESSVKYASDYHTGKPSTDIIMLGHACAPKDQETGCLDVSLTVGSRTKTIRVFGDRQWQNGRISAPKPFKTMPLVYEKAYGGKSGNEETDDVDPRNPVGVGFLGSKTIEAIEIVNTTNGMPLPNLEDPKDLISDPYQQPAPACFSSIAPHWLPRRAYAGSYDETWQTQRAPYLPKDFNPRFFNMAHPDLVYPSFLRGGESVVITNMHPQGDMKFNLPNVKFIADVRVAEQLKQPVFNLETLLIEPNQFKLSMIWRAAVPCDKKALKISEVNISMAR